MQYILPYHTSKTISVVSYHSWRAQTGGNHSRCALRQVIENKASTGDHLSLASATKFPAKIPTASSNAVDATMRAQALSARGGGALEDIMSLTPIGEPRHKVTTASLRDQKLHHEPISCLTAYDYATARLVDEAGIDMVLVGDSLAQTMLGYDNTLSVTMDEMLHHVKAVRRGVKNALLIADMPYGSYQVDTKDALLNATRFVKEGGAEVVKIEGGEKRADLIRHIIDAEIPVAGHIGLTPQSVNVMGGYKVQGKN